jgi:predicted ATPase
LDWRLQDRTGRLQTPEGTGDAPPPDYVRRIRSVAFHRLSGRRLAVPSYTEEEIPRLGEEGEGLASVIGDLKEERRDHFDMLLDHVRMVIPSVRDVRVRRAKVDRRLVRIARIGDREYPLEETLTVAGQELLVDFQDISGVPAVHVSDGTLLVIGAFAALFGRVRKTLLLLDDLENSLHPAAQREFAKALHQLVDPSGYRQVIATTHSPYVVDELAPEEVWVLTQEGGVISARRLSDHPNLNRLRSILSLGEFWSAEGEDWAKAPSPAR